MLLGLWKDLRVTLPWFTGLFIVHTRFLALVHLVNLSRSVSLDKVTEAPRDVFDSPECFLKITSENLATSLH